MARLTSWQSIPTKAVDDADRAIKAKAWGDAQRANVGSAWANVQREMTNQLIKDAGYDMPGEQYEIGGEVPRQSGISSGAMARTLPEYDEGALPDELSRITDDAPTPEIPELPFRPTMRPGLGPRTLQPPPFPLSPSKPVETSDEFIQKLLGGTITGGDLVSETARGIMKQGESRIGNVASTLLKDADRTTIQGARAFDEELRALGAAGLGAVGGGVAGYAATEGQSPAARVAGAVAGVGAGVLNSGKLRRGRVRPTGLLADEAAQFLEQARESGGGGLGDAAGGFARATGSGGAGGGVPKQVPVERFYHGKAEDEIGEYPRAGKLVDGRVVRKEVPDTGSISASLGDDWEELPGIREVPLEYFEAPPVVNARVRKLAEQIAESGELNPLIVILDAEGPYILEGAHRYDALKLLGAKSFPALVVTESTARMVEAAPTYKKMYHGKATEFDEFDPDKMDPNAKYGPGLYVTDTPKVAGSGDQWNKGYGEQRASRSFQPHDYDLLDAETAKFETLKNDSTMSPEDLQDWRTYLQDLEDSTRRQFGPRKPLTGPNIRPINVPDNLNLLDAEAPVPPELARQSERFLGLQPGFLKGINGEMVYARLFEDIGGSLPELEGKKALNKTLAEWGYDGIRYDGGKAMPMIGDDGNPIRHEAVVIFPESLKKVRNAITGKEGGAFAGVGQDEEGNPTFDPERAVLGVAGGTIAGKIAKKGGVRKVLGDAAGIIPPVKPPTAIGTTPPAKQPPREGFAGNVRLEKYDPEVQPIIKGWADTHADEVAEARRGIISDKQVRSLAESLAHEVGVDAKRWKPGQTMKAEEILTLRGTLHGKAEEVLEAQKAVAAGGDSTPNLLRLRLALEEHAAVQRAVTGVSAEAGRALRQFRQSVDSALADNDTAKMEKILRTIGGRGNAADLAKRLGQVDLKNPQQVYQFIRSATTPQLGDYITELFYNSILSSPKTHIVNIASNLINTISSPIERGVAAAVDAPLALLSGRPRARFFGEAGADTYGLLAGLSEGTRAALYTLKNGFTLEQASKLEFRPQAFKGKVGAVINTPSRALQAADQFFSAVLYSGALHGEAYRRAAKATNVRGGQAQRVADLLANPDKALLDRAGHIADYRLYRQEPGKLTERLLHLRDVDVGAGIKPLRFVLPFLQTPANIFKFGLERSPAAWLNPKMWRHVIEKNPEASDEIARALMGSFLAAGIATLYANGQVDITGEAPRGAAERDQFYREGKQAFAVGVGGTNVQYQRIEPVNQTLSQVAAVVDAIKKNDKTADEKAALVVTTIGKNLVSQSYLRGLADALEAFTEPDQNLGTASARFLGSLIPGSSLLRGAAQQLDPVIRKPEGVTERVAAGLPGLSSSVPPRRTVLGNEVRRESSALIPVNITTATDDPVTKELGRLKINVGFAGKSVRGLDLTREEQDTYQRVVGGQIKDLLSRLVETDGYRSLDDRTKAALLERAVTRARDAASGRFLSEQDAGQVRERILRKKAG